jgi:hypothetical protein
MYWKNVQNTTEIISLIYKIMSKFYVENIEHIVRS